MFNFACTAKVSGRELPIAQFNGRFFYRAAADGKEAARATFSDFADGNKQALADVDLAHEFLHWLLFQRSGAGVELVGRRFHARKAFGRNQLAAVSQYYVARTCFMLCSYDRHEQAVTLLEPRLDAFQTQLEVRDGQSIFGKLKQLEVSGEILQLVAEGDAQAVRLCRALGVQRTPAQRAFDRFRGYIATREVGLQSYFLDDAGNLGLHEAAMSAPTLGVVNAAFAPTKGKGTIRAGAIDVAKAIRRRFNTEGQGIPLSHRRMALWSALKFQSELFALRRLHEQSPTLITGGDGPEDFYRRHMVKQLDFIRRHTLNKSSRLHSSLLADTILEIASDPSTITEQHEAVEILAKQAAPFLYFSFNHGN
jgi:hypothetical protein